MASAQGSLPPPAYNFPSAPASSSSGPPIDPHLLPLPYNDDHDLSEPHTIAKASLIPAVKVAGARQKGKKRQLSSDSSDDSDVPAPKRRGGGGRGGRPAGSTNFSANDTTRLLDIVERKKPLGQKGWAAVTKRYNKWAKVNNRPERELKALDAKYKSLLRKKKPTGEGACPPEVKRAHQIEASINHRADIHVPSDDSDIGIDVGGAGAVDISSDDDDIIEVAPSGPSTIRTAVARRAPTPPLRASSPPRRRSRMSAPDLVNRISKAFDPEVQKTRDADCAEGSFQTTHILTLTQQLRDAQAANESLHGQITAMQTRMHDVERAKDRAELKLEFAQAGSSSTGPSSRRPSRSAVYKENPDLVRVGGKVRYRSSDDEEKENWDPSSSSSSAYYDDSFFFNTEQLSSPLAKPEEAVEEAVVSVAESTSVADGGN